MVDGLPVGDRDGDLQAGHSRRRTGNGYARGKLRAQPERLLAFRLCLELGFPHPDYLLELLTPEQFEEWAAYYSLEPWGFHVADMHTGTIGTAVLAAAGAKDVSPRDFMIRTSIEESFVEREDPPAKVEAVLDLALGIAKARAEGKLPARPRQAPAVA